MEILKLHGLDDYSKSYLDEYWAKFQKDKSFSEIIGVSISSTNRCNLRCIYCYAGEDRVAGKDELTLKEQKDIIYQSSLLGAKTVIICGDGEPTVDKNLIEIVEYAQSRNMISIIVNNGIVFGDDSQARKIHGVSGQELLEKLYKANASLIVKMESIEKESYEYIVGVKNTFPKLMESIKRIVETGFCEDYKTGVTRLAFSSVIMKNNIDQLERLKKFADDNHAQYICKLPSLVGTALTNIDNMFEVKKYEEIRKNIFKYTAKRETLMVDTPRCMAWHYGPCIDVKGEIRECYTSAYSSENRVGNIRQTSLKELIMIKKDRCNLTCNDFCPVKTRINEELIEKGLEKVWIVKNKGKQLSGY